MKTLPIFALILFVAGSAMAQTRIESSKPDARTCKGTVIEPVLFKSSGIVGRVLDAGGGELSKVELELTSSAGRTRFKLRNGTRWNFRVCERSCGTLYAQSEVVKERT